MRSVVPYPSTHSSLRPRATPLTVSAQDHQYTEKASFLFFFVVLVSPTCNLLVSLSSSLPCTDLPEAIVSPSFTHRYVTQLDDDFSYFPFPSGRVAVPLHRFQSPVRPLECDLVRHGRFPLTPLRNSFMRLPPTCPFLFFPAARPPLWN